MFYINMLLRQTSSREISQVFEMIVSDNVITLMIVAAPHGITGNNTYWKKVLSVMFL